MKPIPLNSNPIVSVNVFEFVVSKLNFELTFNQWKVIDVAMGEYWNNRKIGAWICNEDNADLIYKHCTKSKILVSYGRILKITNLIWEYLASNGRLVDE